MMRNNSLMMVVVCVVVLIGLGSGVESVRVISVNSEQEFASVLELSVNKPIFAVFLDNEHRSKQMVAYWELKQQMLANEAQVVIVNVKSAIELQRKYEVHERGDAILFKNKVEYMRTGFIDESKMDFWVDVMIKPHESITKKNVQQLNNLIHQSKKSVLVLFSNNVKINQFLALQPNRDAYVVLLKREELPTLISQFPIEAHSTNHSSINELKQVIHSYEENSGTPSSFLFFYNVKTARYFYDIFMKSDNDVGNIYEIAFKISDYVEEKLIVGEQSIAEATKENMDEYFRLYSYVCLFPYRDEVEKERFLPILHKVEENDEFSKFGFLYKLLTDGSLMLPMCIESERMKSAIPRENRFVWNPDLELNVKNLQNWIERIKNGKADRFTHLQSKYFLNFNDYIELEEPFTSEVDYKTHEKFIADEKHKFKMIFYYNSNNKRSFDYKMLIKQFSESAGKDYHFKYYMYNVILNSYLGPAAPSISIVYDGEEKFIPPHLITKSSFEKSVISAVNNLSRRGEL